ncbi:MAG TPA: hypothetical protein VE978_07735 [Chitinophagales bacterium]|nr:hypothetical protein [Chitinophagales bacterium]
MKANRNYHMLMMGIFFLMLIPFTGFSQNENSWLNNLSSEDSAAVNALVLYADSIRLSIFEACKYPEVIVRIAVLQKNTSQNFTDLISNYSRKEQEDLWNLTRYPGLIDALVTGGKKSKEEINVILRNYPDEIHDVALSYGRNYFDALQRMDQLYKGSDHAFEEILRSYPSSAQDAFHDLVDLPEVLSILNDHMQMTVLVGDMLKRNPQHVIRMADSLNLVVAQQNAEEVADWKKTIEDNPDAQKDLQGAALDYAQQNCDYDEETCMRPPTAVY